ncbi:hypothetical protein [Paenibacillus sp. NPDC058174]|uniref:hypothetical protein n=1 Tax=Paenibacillus sp. NPDC058174 TaxID=3346366 RepID=UPI0036DACF79
MKKRFVSLPLILFLLLLSGNVFAATSNPAETIPYPYGQYDCGSLPQRQCEYYYAETHFDGKVAWNGVAPTTKINISEVRGTYTSSTSTYDTWELERVSIYEYGTLIPPTLPTLKYDSTAHDGEKLRDSYSSNWVKYYPNTVVANVNNRVILYYELRLYTIAGSPNQTLFPKRTVSGITL